MIVEHAVEEPTARRLVAQLLAVEVASLAFCRLLERWARGRGRPEHARAPAGGAPPCRRPRRDGARRARAAARPLPDRAGGRLGRGPVVVRRARAARELVDWQPVLDRAGVKSRRIASRPAYLELAVLVRALEGLASQVRWQSAIDRGSLWAGPLRPAREPARPRARRPARDRRLTASHERRAHGRRLDQPRSRRARRAAAARRGDGLRRATSSAFPAARARTRRSRPRSSARRCAWSARSATTRSPTRRSRGCRPPASSSSCAAPDTTGIALILVADDGENQIVVVPGANARGRRRRSPGGAVLCQLEVPGRGRRRGRARRGVLRAQRRAGARRSTSSPTC